MKIKVYIYISQWGNGESIEGSTYGKVFTKLEEAQGWLNNEAEQAIETIKSHYYDDYWEEENDDKNTRLIADSDEYRDWWEGTITEQEIEI